MAAFILYDDKYGFEPTATCSSAFEGAQKVHTWLGARFDPKKLQLWCDPTILSVTYDRNGMLLKNKPSRKVELEEEIGSILECQVFPPGHTGKLCGKLMFGASQLWGQDLEGVSAIFFGTLVLEVVPRQAQQSAGAVTETVAVAG